MSWSAAGLDLDLRTEIISFSDLELTSGEWALTANTAQTRGPDPHEGDWQLSGDVRLASARLTIDAERARVTVESGEIEQVRLTGSPVTVVHRADEQAPKIVRGRAPRVEFHPLTGILRFEERAQVSTGPSEVSADTIVYDLNEETLRADGSRERVEITMERSRQAQAE